LVLPCPRPVSDPLVAMDRDQKLIMFVDSLGEGADVDFARQILEAHEWDVEAALDTVTAGGAAATPGLPTAPQHAVDADGYRAPMATGYTDRLLGPDPEEEQMAWAQAQAAVNGDFIGDAAMHPGAAGHAELQRVMALSMAEHNRTSDQHEQGFIAQAIEASIRAPGSLLANADAERKEQEMINRAIEASYLEQNTADETFRQQLAQATALSQGATGESDANKATTGPPLPTSASAARRISPLTASGVTGARAFPAGQPRAGVRPLPSRTASGLGGATSSAADGRPPGATSYTPGASNIGAVGFNNAAQARRMSGPQTASAQLREAGPPTASAQLRERSGGQGSAARTSAARQATGTPISAPQATRAPLPRRSMEFQPYNAGTQSSASAVSAGSRQVPAPLLPSRISAAASPAQPLAQRQRSGVGSLTAAAAAAAAAAEDPRSATRQQPPRAAPSRVVRPHGMVSPYSAPGQEAAAHEAQEADRRRKQQEAKEAEEARLAAEREAAQARAAAEHRAAERQAAAQREAAERQAIFEQAQREAAERQAAAQRELEERRAAQEAAAAREAERQRRAAALERAELEQRNAAMEQAERERRAAAIEQAERERAAIEQAERERRAAAIEQAARAQPTLPQPTEPLEEAPRQELPSAASRGRTPPPGEKDEVVKALVALRRGYLESDPAGLTTCLQTLKTLIGNLARNPQDPKFQRVRCDTGAFRSKIAPFEGATAVLKACGFSEQEEEGAWVVDPAYIKSKGPRLFDALAKVEVMLNQAQARGS